MLDNIKANNLKFQIPNSKSQTNQKSQYPNFQTKKFWSLGIWSLVIIWNLVLGNWNLSYPQDKIAAIVNCDIITQKDLNDFINFTRMQLSRDLSGQELEKKIQSMKLHLLDRLIEDRLILQEAKKLGISIEPNRIKAKIDEIRQHYNSELEFQNAISKQGLVEADLEQKIREQFLMFSCIDFKVRSKIEVNPTEVTLFYQNNPQMFKVQEEREFESLYIDDAKVAREIYNELKKTEGFEEVAKRYSLSVNRLTGRKSGELKKEIEEAVFRLNKDEISEPVKIDNNYYLLKVVNIIAPRQLNLTEAQDEIYTYIFNTKMEEGLSDWLDELKKQSYLKICQD